MESAPLRNQDVKVIEVAEAEEKLSTPGLKAVLADVRDNNAFDESHDERAFHLTNETYKKFKEEVDIK